MISRSIATSSGSSAPLRSIFSRLAVGRALHLVDGLLQRQALNGVAVDLGDEVARHDAGLGRRRVVDRRHHLDKPVFHRDLDAEPAEFAMRGLLHVVPALLIHVARMRIERGDHAVDGAFDQLGIVGLLDIAALDPLEHVAEQIELGIGVGARRGLCRHHPNGPERPRRRRPPDTRPSPCREERQNSCAWWSAPCSFMKDARRFP